MSLDTLAEVSRRYGSNPDFVLAGGGNTSFKDDDTLFIKASGHALATIEPNGFVRMDRRKLGEIWEADYPDDTATREARALADLMDARLPGEESKRPSVETLVHEALPEAWVVHTHPALVNGLTCSEGAEQRAKELFGDEVLWIPLVEPGYVLARTVRRMQSAHVAAYGKGPRLILLQNHGIFVGGNTVSEVDETYRWVFEVLEAAVTVEPDTSDAPVDTQLVDTIGGWIARGSGDAAVVSFGTHRGLLEALADAAGFDKLSSAYTPDHIVYSGARPLYLTSVPEKPETIAEEIATFTERFDRSPKVIAIRNLGAFGIGMNETAAERAVTLFLDAFRIGTFAQDHGGHRFLTSGMIRFILNWEVEQYRSKVSDGQ